MGSNLKISGRSFKFFPFVVYTVAKHWLWLSHFLLRRGFMERYWICAARSECRCENQNIYSPFQRILSVRTAPLSLCRGERLSHSTWHSKTLDQAIHVWARYPPRNWTNLWPKKRERSCWDLPEKFKSRLKLHMRVQGYSIFNFNFSLGCFYLASTSNLSFQMLFLSSFFCDLGYPEKL